MQVVQVGCRSGVGRWPAKKGLEALKIKDFRKTGVGRAGHLHINRIFFFGFSKDGRKKETINADDLHDLHTP